MQTNGPEPKVHDRRPRTVPEKLAVRDIRHEISTKSYTFVKIQAILLVAVVANEGVKSIKETLRGLSAEETFKEFCVLGLLSGRRVAAY